MIVLGVDPGSRCAGYGLVEVKQGKERLLEYGVMRFTSKDSHQKRLRQIYERLEQVVDACPPDECAIEMPVYARNPQSMLKLGRAQAAAMLVVLNRDVPVVEYTPKEVKKAVTGNGNATKRQVAYMVRSILQVDKDADMSLDASDALAVSLCHAHRSGQDATESYGGWADYVRANPDRVG